ncbi:ankyrin repeat domain-containing protein [Wolbachia endosymbiont of Chironomus riparius]|uniref:ankyrin repeat domain-containing protein n=1 Tax=Wolbachia endosymbiont of Chironomus riparius TaxID=2883238 RepID=UPI00209FB543|nr:ankyrin repeat domain-containing protein [Wolbachia endosymbiont of Chironomus riparius]
MSKEATEKLFKAIDDESLNDFEKALKEGANVNEFDEDGMTPLFVILIQNDDSKIKLKMLEILLKEEILQINSKCMMSNSENFTALQLAFKMKNFHFVKLLLRHSELEIPETIEDKEIKNQFQREINKAKNGRELLDNLSKENIDLARSISTKDFNPNCWNGGIKTIFEYAIDTCLQGLSQDKKNLLEKLLKHKDFDFIQIQSYCLSKIKQNHHLEQFITQTIKGRLIDEIKNKDLDNIKQLVEDNCLMNHTIVNDAMKALGGSVNESIKKYLDEKFPVVSNIVLSASIMDDFENEELTQIKLNIAQETKKLQRLQETFKANEEEIKLLNIAIINTQKEIDTEIKFIENENKKCHYYASIPHYTSIPHEERIESFLDKDNRHKETIKNLEEQNKNLEREISETTEMLNENNILLSIKTEELKNRKSSANIRITPERSAPTIIALQDNANPSSVKNQTQVQFEHKATKKQLCYGLVCFVLSGACVTAAIFIHIIITSLTLALAFLALGCYFMYQVCNEKGTRVEENNTGQGKYFEINNVECSSDCMYGFYSRSN